MDEETSRPDGASPRDADIRPSAPRRWTGTLHQDNLVILASRSSGPGGQNVNKVATKAQVRLDVMASEDLSPAEQAQVLRYVAEMRPSLLTRHNEILITNNETRSFHDNRNRAIQLLEELITEALTVKKKRVPTRTPRSAIARRLEGKKHLGAIKKSRSARPDEE